MPIHLSPRAWLLLKISFLITFSESMLVPMYAVFTEKVGGSILDAGIAYAVFSIATGLMIGLLGTRDVFERHTRLFLIAGFLVTVVCDIGYIFVQNRWQLFGAQVLAGLASGLIEPAWDALFSDGIEEASAKHWSIWAGGTHFLGGLAAVAGGAIVWLLSFTVLFIVMAVIDVAAVILLIHAGFHRGDLDATESAAATEEVQPPLRSVDAG